METVVTIIVILVSISVIFALLSLLISYFFTSAVIRPPKRSLEFALRYHIDKQGLPENFYTNLSRVPWQFKSQRGYTLYGEMIFPGKQTDASASSQSGSKLLIAVHGHGHNRMGMLKFLPVFLDQGFTVLIYDQVSSGNSGGRFSSLGYYEAQDLRCIIDSMLSEQSGEYELGLLGESMGAATVLIEAAADNRPAFLVADCPFADLRSQLIYRLSFAYRLPSFPIIQLGSIIARIRAGFSWQDVSPLESIKNAGGLPDIPVLFVHGEADTYIPAQSSQLLFNAKTGYKDILIVPEARHTESIVIDSKSYESAITRLLEHSRHKLTH